MKKKRKKRSVALARQPPVLSTIPMLQYLPVLVNCWLAGWLAGWRLKPSEGKEETRCFRHKLQRAASRGFGGRRRGKEREKVQHSLCSEWATQQPLGKNLALNYECSSTSVFKPSKTPKKVTQNKQVTCSRRR